MMMMMMMWQVTLMLTKSSLLLPQHSAQSGKLEQLPALVEKIVGWQLSSVQEKPLPLPLLWKPDVLRAGWDPWQPGTLWDNDDDHHDNHGHRDHCDHDDNCNRDLLPFLPGRMLTSWIDWEAIGSSSCVWQNLITFNDINDDWLFLDWLKWNGFINLMTLVMILMIISPVEIVCHFPPPFLPSACK